MSLSALAWGPGHPTIVTYDEKELLAYDSESEGPKWRLEVEKPIVGVVLADATFLDLGDVGSPFRTPAAVRAVLAASEDGRLYAVDASTGRRLGDVGPFGAPRALAASAIGQGIALAVPGKILIWRKGTRAETMLDATAVAFSIDGATLAIATEQGVVKMFDLTGLDDRENIREVLSFDARGPVNDLAQHPSGGWLVAGSRATVLVTGPGSEKNLEKIPGGTKRIRFDARGLRVAAQLSERQILVYEWPQLSVLTRIEYTERPVRGVAFGNADWLGVAMDLGDGNKIDVVTTAVHRTDTHPGRQHNSWSLYVEGGKKAPAGLSPSDEDAIRRIKEPIPHDSSGIGRGGRIGIISVISLCLIGLKVCVRLGSSGSSYPSSYSSSGYTAPAKCDQACATERVQRLVKDCAGAVCGKDANDAASALAVGDCAGAQAAIARIPDRSPNIPLLSVDKLLADLGVKEACESGAIAAKAKKRIVHPRLVRLVGAALSETSEEIPEIDGAEGERPRAAWTASDGTLFVGGVAGRDIPKAVIHRRTPDGNWDQSTIGTVPGDDVSFSLVGRSAIDVWALIGPTLSHWDGKQWEGVESPQGNVDVVTVTTKDVFVAAIPPATSRLHTIYRRSGNVWVKDTDLGYLHVRAGGPSLWALGRSIEKPIAAVRGADGRWATKSLAPDAGVDATLTDLWVSPQGDPFAFTDGAVLRGSNGGAKWVEEDLAIAGAIKAIWGRSSSDVYAASFSRLMHFDGKAWNPTSYVGKTAALSGTAKEVFVVRADD
jgi:hypothetical protein